MFFLSSLDSSTSQFRTERIKIPPARYPRSTGSDRGGLAAISWGRQEVPAEPGIWNHTLLPLPLQGPSRIQSAAAQHLQCRPSTWRHHPSPAANHRAPFLLNPGYRSVLLQLATGGRTGKLAVHPDGRSAIFCLSFWLRAGSWEASYYQNAEPHFVVWFISVLSCSPLNP